MFVLLAASCAQMEHVAVDAFVRHLSALLPSLTSVQVGDAFQIMSLSVWTLPLAVLMSQSGVKMAAANLHAQMA